MSSLHTTLPQSCSALLYESKAAFNIVRNNLLELYETLQLPANSFAIQRISDLNKDDEFIPSVRTYFIFKVAQYLKASKTVGSLQSVFSCKAELQYAKVPALVLDSFSKISVPNAIKDDETDYAFPVVLRSELLQKLAVIGELSITVMYLDNHFYDLKYGVNLSNPESRARNRWERKLIWEALHNYVKKEFTTDEQEIVQRLIKALFHAFKEGMKIDQQALSFQNFINDNASNLHAKLDIEVELEANDPIILLLRPAEKKINKHGFSAIQNENYLQLLLTRCDLLNAKFYQFFTEALIDILGLDSLENDGQGLISWARRFGIITQLVNDVNDYMPQSYGYKTTTKLAEDTWSDGRRKLFTLPIMILFSNSPGHPFSDALKAHYMGEKIDELDLFDDAIQSQGFQCLKENKVFSYCMHVLCKLAKGSSSLLDQANPVQATLVDMLKLAHGNRYFKQYN